MISNIHKLAKQGKQKLFCMCNDTKAIATAKLVANGVLSESELDNEIIQMQDATKKLINEKEQPNVYFIH